MSSPPRDTLPQVMDLGERRAVQRAMLARFAATEGVPALLPARVRLGDVSSVHIAGSCPTTGLYVAVCPQVSALTVDDLPSVAQEIFTLSLLRAARPEARVVLLFAGEAARDSVLSWVQHVHGAGGIEFAVVQPLAA